MRLAVTGVTGTVGLALGTLIERDPRVEALTGVARRPFRPAARGWSKCTYVQADVRDERALVAAFTGADAVVHLAFDLYGMRRRAELDAINVGGTVKAFEAARQAGATRFVHASSAAAYGVPDTLPQPIREDAPVRPDARHFYTDHKARAEAALLAAAAAPGAPALTLLRPCGIAGPHALTAFTRRFPSGLRRAGVVAFGAGLRPPVFAPPVPLQMLHPADAASAFLAAALGEGPPGAYNVAPDDVLDGVSAMRELGLPVVPAPRALRAAALRALVSLPVPLPAWTWLQMLRGPYVLDASKLRDAYGWRPEHSSREALAATRAAWSA